MPFEETDSYVATADPMVAVDAAIALERPLLVKGEPGTGKFIFAHKIAKALEKRLITWPIKPTTKAKQGLYEYDAVARLRGSQLSRHSFKANAVRMQRHALVSYLANFLRTLALPAEAAQWSMTTQCDRLVKIGAEIVRHGRSITFQMAEVMVPRALFQRILAAITEPRPTGLARC